MKPPPFKPIFQAAACLGWLLPSFSPAATNLPSLVWPAPPDAARIAYVTSIHRPADAGIKASGWGRLTRWLTGSDKGNEPLQKPFGLALDDQDNLCLTDTGAHAVCFFDRTKKQWQRWTQLGDLAFSSPVAVAKYQQIFFVADSGLASVVAFNSKGKLLFQITNGLERPCALTVNPERLWVADSQRHCVSAFDLAGRFLAALGRRGSGPGEFNFPTHLAQDAAHNLFVTDSGNGRIQMFDASGQFLRQVGSLGDNLGHFGRPKGVAVDALGHVYVVDALFDNLQIFDRESRFLMPLGAAGTGPGQFFLPSGIGISRHNEIFVADTYNHRVQVLQYVGEP